MKKVKNFIEYIFIFIFGYILFNFAISTTQVIVYNIFGLILDFKQTYMHNAKKLFIIYLLIFLIILFLNYIYNCYYIKRLNKSLKILKGRRDENYEE